MQQHSGVKEVVSKRSGTTGGTDSKNNLLKTSNGDAIEQ